METCCLLSCAVSVEIQLHAHSRTSRIPDSEVDLRRTTFWDVLEHLQAKRHTPVCNTREMYCKKSLNENQNQKKFEEIHKDHTKTTDANDKIVNHKVDFQEIDNNENKKMQPRDVPVKKDEEKNGVQTARFFIRKRWVRGWRRMGSFSFSSFSHSY